MVRLGLSSRLTFALMRASMSVVLVAVVVMVTHLRNTKKTKKQNKTEERKKKDILFNTSFTNDYVMDYVIHTFLTSKII